MECRFASEVRNLLFFNTNYVLRSISGSKQLTVVLFCPVFSSKRQSSLLCFHVDLFTSSPSIEELKQLFAFLLSSSRNIKRAQVWGDWRPDAAINTAILGHRLDGLSWQPLRLVSVPSKRSSKQVATVHTTVNSSSQPVTTSLPVIRFSPVCCHSTNTPQSSAVRDRPDRLGRWHFGSSLNKEVWLGRLFSVGNNSKLCLLNSPFLSNCNDYSMAERSTVCPIVTTPVWPNVVLFVQL